MSRNASKTVILATVLLPLLGAPAIAFSLDTQTMGKINHVVECATWLVQGDPRHAKYCIPSHVTTAQLHDLINFTGSIEATSPANNTCPSGGGAAAAIESSSSSSSQPCYD